MGPRAARGGRIGLEHSQCAVFRFPGLSFGGAYEDTYSVGADL